MRLRHGGELRLFSEKFGIPEREILDFSSNINPWGPPDSVREIFESLKEELRVYPDSEALAFRREVARHFPIFPENVIAGNGAAELLDLILRLLRPKRALLIEPTFLEYRRLLNLQGAQIRSISLREKDSFRFSPSEVANALLGVDVAIFAHPNNPTGTHLSRESLQHLLGEAKRRNIFIVLDEAFVDWTPELSMAKEVRDDSFFFVVRSLTKFFALPGIRIGYGLGSRKLIEKLNTLQVPWSCNRLAQKLGETALRDGRFINESRDWLSTERDWLEAGLQKISWLKAYPSASNFLLVRHAPSSEGRSLIEAMAKRGIYLRDLTEFPGLGPTYFRVAVRKREENEKLLAALCSRDGSGGDTCAPKTHLSLLEPSLPEPSPDWSPD